MNNNWTYKKLGEVTSKCKNIKWSEHEGEKIIYIDLTAVNRDTKLIDLPQEINASNAPSRAKQIIKENDILFATTRPTLKRVCRIPKEYDNQICSTGFCVLRPSSNILPNYLFYILLSDNFYGYIEPLQTGANYPAVSDEIVRNYSIPIPPLSEQEAIVKELDLIHSIIDKKNEQLRELDNLAQSIFYTMFGDPIINDKNWEVKTWADTITIINGKNQKMVESPNGKYVICGSGGIMGRANDFLCPKDSIIIGRKGNINNPILMREQYWNVDTAFGLVPNTSLLNADYLYRFCCCFDFENLNVAVTIPSLRKIDLLKISIPLPPLSLQQEFAKKVEAIELQKELIRKSIAEVETLLASRMQHYFG